MSFILDALKKSESERKRQDAPGIASIPESGRHRASAKWPLLVAGLLVINLAVIAVIMLKPDAAETTASPTTAALIEPAEESFSEIVREAKRTTPQSAAAPQPEPVAASTAAVATPPVTSSITEGLPTLNELRASGQIQLPDMHLDIHVYSGQPADRFVFVNMSKYKEGATLSEGPQVSEIAPDGVVLEYFGLRFLLPRE